MDLCSTSHLPLVVHLDYFYQHLHPWKAQDQIQVHQNLYQLAYHHQVLDYMEVSCLCVFWNPSRYQSHGFGTDHLNDQDQKHGGYLRPYVVQES